jgi:hypothetical protein
MMAIATLIVLANTSPGAVAIAIAGMLIVAIALSLISLFIAALPRVLEQVSRYLPEGEDRHAQRMPAESDMPDDEAITAAIGFVLYTEFQNQLARERGGSKS